MEVGDITATLRTADETVRRLERLGLAYQGTIQPGDLDGLTDAAEQAKLRQKLEVEFERAMSPGPLPIVRALQIHGLGSAADALHELWDTVFSVTSLFAVSVGVAESEVLEFDVISKADAARRELRAAQEFMLSRDFGDQAKSERLAVALDATLLVDAMARLGSDYFYYLSDPDAPLPVGDEGDETNEEACARTKREFAQLDVETCYKELAYHDLGSQARAIVELAAIVGEMMNSDDIKGLTVEDLYDRRDKIVSALASGHQ